jgi:hydroxymethylbilane synthase
MLPSKLRIGTRSSPLALKQTHLFESSLSKELYIKTEIVPMITSGDQITDRPLAEVGGKGLFAKELERALLNGEIDCAVHSLKDLEHTFHPDLLLVAVLPRETPWDVLVSAKNISLIALKEGASIGTCSPRRKIQLQRFRPDLNIVMVRGNVQTRLAKLKSGEMDGLILAQAGLRRLQMEDIITEVIPLDVMIPAVGQGVIAIQTRKDDVDLNQALHKINDQQTFQEIKAERTMLQTVQGDCYTPIGGYATMIEGQIHLTGMLADHRSCWYATHQGIDPEEVGYNVGNQLKKLAGWSQ